MKNTDIRIILSAMAAESASFKVKQSFVARSGIPVESELSGIFTFAQGFAMPKLARQLRYCDLRSLSDLASSLEKDNANIRYQSDVIGSIKILYKTPLPGELQSRLAFESAIERFVEYLQRRYQIIMLDESDRHVQLFIPAARKADFNFYWDEFLKQIAFSKYGSPSQNLPGLVQTFVLMLKSITLSARGFSTLDIPILTKDQASVIAAWYYAVIRDVGMRQVNRERSIQELQQLLNDESDAKKKQSYQKELDDKAKMQIKEKEKYSEQFEKSFYSLLVQHRENFEELDHIAHSIDSEALPVKELRKLKKHQSKLLSKIFLFRESIEEKLELIKQVGFSPFQYIQAYETKDFEKFKDIKELANSFDKTATDQINSTRGDIFIQCVTEMFRLLELDEKDYESLPLPLLTEKPVVGELRSPGDDSKEFCYSCGVKLDPKKARWQVLRFMFERPSQRRQSSSGEGRPYICATCSALAFASPIKVAEDNIILKLEPKGSVDAVNNSRISDYIRMIASKEMHLCAGKYMALTSDRTAKGELASQKLGAYQYALAKVASIFPQDVLTDFQLSLVDQGSTNLVLTTRHLIYISGLMKNYQQTIVLAGKDINMTLGDAVRLVQKDLPYLAEYTLVKTFPMVNLIGLEQTREQYWREFSTYSGGDLMKSRAKLYQDVAALTGIACAFVGSLETTTKKLKPNDDDYRTREMSKLIEKVDDATAFCYFATLGDEEKASVQARLYKNPSNEFTYKQTVNLLNKLNLSDRESTDNEGRIYLQLYADDVTQAYSYFAQEAYNNDKDWKELTYNLKLSVYTRFPELVRKLKSTSEK